MTQPTKPDLKYIYAHQADQYQDLVAFEDYENQLPAALDALLPPGPLDIVETGAGTGRLSVLLAPRARSLRLFDASPGMLAVAKARLAAGGWQHWKAGVADHLALPVEDGSADLTIAGWTLCYAALDHPLDWQNAVRRALGEMERVLRPGGMLIVIETEGTGFAMPHPPETLRHYLGFLREYGLHSRVIRTDFRFETVEQAAAHMNFFFGPQMAERTRHEFGLIVPECTGIWWKQV